MLASTVDPLPNSMHWIVCRILACCGCRRFDRIGGVCSLHLDELADLHLHHVLFVTVYGDGGPTPPKSFDFAAKLILLDRITHLDRQLARFLIGIFNHT